MANLARRREKRFFLLFSGIVGLILLIITGYQLLEFTESSTFCGRVCHEVMHPQYTVYQESVHAEENCSECHVGSGWVAYLKSKADNVPIMISTLANSYDRPIPTPVDNLPPTDETCEACHGPEIFAGDVERVFPYYKTDKQNTEETKTKIFNVGSDESEGIHWHVNNRVWYLPLDEQRLEIGWVGVEQSDGELIEYIDPDAGEISHQRIEDGKRLMDCTDCHNRDGHDFLSPIELIDLALFQGKIDSSLPFINREGLEALNSANSSLEETFAKIEAIKDFYRISYPMVYLDERPKIDAAVEELREIVRLTTFPRMEVTSETYPNQLGHDDSPGCWRCHGELEATTVGQEVTVIDRSCFSCHEGNPPVMKHPIEGAEGCIECHVTGEAGATLMSDIQDHAERTDSEICTTCHVEPY